MTGEMAAVIPRMAAIGVSNKQASARHVFTVICLQVGFSATSIPRRAGVAANPVFGEPPYHFREADIPVPIPMDEYIGYLASNAISVQNPAEVLPCRPLRSAARYL
jgi:hypothetical protein